MLSDLGSKRVLIISVFLALNALLVLYLFVYLFPDLKQTETALTRVRGESVEKEAELRKTQKALASLDLRKDDFENIKKIGFIGKQDRREAERLLKKIRKITKILKAKASFSRAKFVDDPDAQRSGRLVMENLITIDLEALSDVDIFRYIYLLENHFSGHLTIKYINLKREKNPDGAVLRSIANGDNPVVARAKIEVVWRSMVTKEESEEEL